MHRNNFEITLHYLKWLDFKMVRVLEYRYSVVLWGNPNGKIHLAKHHKELFIGSKYWFGHHDFQLLSEMPIYLGIHRPCFFFRSSEFIFSLEILTFEGNTASAISSH